MDLAGRLQSRKRGGEKKKVKSLVFWVFKLELVKSGYPVCRYLERHFFTVATWVLFFVRCLLTGNPLIPDCTCFAFALLA